MAFQHFCSQKNSSSPLVTRICNEQLCLSAPKKKFFEGEGGRLTLMELFSSTRSGYKFQVIF